MKNPLICFILLIFSGHTLNANNNVKLSVVKLEPTNRDQLFPDLYKYNIEFELRNEGIEPLNFWTWSCGWDEVFILQDGYIPIECNSNYPIRKMILPSMCFKYNSTLYSKCRTLDNNSITIGFVYISVYAFKNTYTVLDLFRLYRLSDYGYPENTILWNRDPLMFVKKACFWDFRTWNGYEKVSMSITQAEFKNE